MRFLSIILFFLTLILPQHSQAQQTIFSDDFNSNSNYWDLSNNPKNEIDISAGSLRWKRDAPKSSVLMQYMNTLDESADFTFSAVIQVKKINSEYGLVWGGKWKGDARYFLIRGNKARLMHAKDGKIAGGTEYKMNLKISLSTNLIEIKKQGGTVKYLINEKEIYSEPYTGMSGKEFGFTLWGSSSISIDEMTLKGKKLKINELEGLYYHDKPEQLSEAVNTTADEMNPIISADGNTLYFSRKFHSENVGGPTDFEDAYVSVRSGNSWKKAQNMGAPINNHGPNAVHAISPDGNTVLLMNTYEPNGKPKGQGLSVSHQMMEGWSIPETFKIRQYYNVSGFNEFFLSNNGKILLLAIERNEHPGSRDLYVSLNEGNDIWSEPKYMGKTLNTPGTELSPFLASDGKTLYFSSNGHPGYGRNDIFMSKRLDESWTNWSEPQNLGQPVNGPGQDSYYSVPASGEFAYFVSAKAGAGHTDIYRIKLPSTVRPNPVVLIKGHVYNEKTKEPLGAPITYRDFDSDKEAGIARSNPSTGYYEIVLPLEQAYSFFAEKDGFYSVRDRIDLKATSDYEEIEVDLYLSPIEEGRSTVLNNVLFRRATGILLPSSYPELDKLAQLLLDNPTMEIELTGHTDNVGSEQALINLSDKRVVAVRDYLVRKGIHVSRISGKGMGSSQPIAPNDSEKNKQKNRRVEFRIIKK